MSYSVIDSNYLVCGSGEELMARFRGGEVVKVVSETSLSTLGEIVQFDCGKCLWLSDGVEGEYLEVEKKDSVYPYTVLSIDDEYLKEG